MAGRLNGKGSWKIESLKGQYLFGGLPCSSCSNAVSAAEIGDMAMRAFEVAE